MWSWFAMALAGRPVAAGAALAGAALLRRGAYRCGRERLRGAIGTLAHNRQFTVSEVSRYIGCDARADVARMRQKGLVERVGPGRYFPTRRGWAWIERS